MLSSAEILCVVTEQAERRETLGVLMRWMIRAEALETGRHIANALKAHALPTDFKGDDRYCHGWVVPGISAREKLANEATGRKIGVALLAGVGFTTFIAQEGNQYVGSVRDLGADPTRDNMVWSVGDVEASLTQAAQVLEGQAESYYYGGARQFVETQPAHAA